MLTKPLNLFYMQTRIGDVMMPGTVYEPTSFAQASEDIAMENVMSYYCARHLLALLYVWAASATRACFTRIAGVSELLLQPCKACRALFEWTLHGVE